MLDYDFKWTQQPQAVERLNYYLWQLGVVQGFHHSLAEAVGQIKAVENILVAQVHDVGYLRPSSLLRQVMRVSANV